MSKCICSYSIGHKSVIETLWCLKIYVQSFGKPNKNHTDNSSEFSNILFNNYYTENNILHCFSKPYSLKSAGEIGVSHK